MPATLQSLRSLSQTTLLIERQKLSTALRCTHHLISYCCTTTRGEEPPQLGTKYSIRQPVTLSCFSTQIRYHTRHVWSSSLQVLEETPVSAPQTRSQCRQPESLAGHLSLSQTG